jgi:hypothetical protein
MVSRAAACTHQQTKVKPFLTGSKINAAVQPSTPYGIILTGESQQHSSIIVASVCGTRQRRSHSACGQQRRVYLCTCVFEGGVGLVQHITCWVLCFVHSPSLSLSPLAHTAHRQNVSGTMKDGFVVSTFYELSGSLLLDESITNECTSCFCSPWRNATTGASAGGLQLARVRPCLSFRQAVLADPTYFND